MGPISRKLIYSLALIPIVPATSAFLTELVFNWGGLPGWDQLRTWHLFVAVLVQAAVILLWRRMVIWSLGRAFLTVLVGMIPYVQVAIAQGWWSFPSSGCIDLRPDILRTGQFHFGLGIWSWLLVWLWWGMEKTIQTLSDAPPKSRRLVARRIPDAAMRILSSIGSIPLVFGIFWILYVALDTLILPKPMNAPFDMAAGYLAGSVPAVAVWLFIWRGAMSEPARGTRRAIAWAALLIDLPAAMLLAIPTGGTLLDDGFYCAPIIGWGAWMAMTPRFLYGRLPYRTSLPSEAAEGPRCPSCGYLLIGLTSTRCPECGSEPTLDVLWRENTMELSG